jgi:spore coat protein U-like protein
MELLMRLFSLNTISKLALAGFFAVAGTAVNAQATGSLPVSATVQATCVIGSIDALAFGTYVQGAGAKTALGTINLNCGTNIAYSVRLSGLVGSTNRTMTAGANALQYQIYRDSAYQNVWGETDSLNTVDGSGTGLSASIPVYGRIADGGPNLTAAPGLYNAVVTVTVAY